MTPKRSHFLARPGYIAGVLITLPDFSVMRGRTNFALDIAAFVTERGARAVPAAQLALVVREAHASSGRVPHLTSLMTTRVSIGCNTGSATGLRSTCNSE